MDINIADIAPYYPIYYTGLAVWFIVLSFLFGWLFGKLVTCFCAFVFLVRRFRTWDRGGFSHGNPAWLFFSRWFMYTWFSSWRLSYAEDHDGKKVWWPFENRELRFGRTHWIEKVKVRK